MIDQSVAPNAPVMVNTVVDFTVAVPLDGMKFEITLTPPAGDAKTAFSETLSRGTHMVELTSEEAGLHQVKVYIDGVLMETTDVMFD